MKNFLPGVPQEPVFAQFRFLGIMGIPMLCLHSGFWFGKSVFGFSDISPPFSLLMLKTFSRGALDNWVFGICVFLDIFSPLCDDSHVP
jgi:hypothetical protein